MQVPPWLTATGRVLRTFIAALAFALLLLAALTANLYLLGWIFTLGS